MHELHLGHLHELATAAGAGAFGDLSTALRLHADRQDIAAAVEWATWQLGGALGDRRRAGRRGRASFDLELAWVDGLRSTTSSAAAPIHDPELAEELRSVGLALRVRRAFDPEPGRPAWSSRGVAGGRGASGRPRRRRHDRPASHSTPSRRSGQAAGGEAVPPQRRSRTFAAADAALARPRVAAAADGDLAVASSWFRARPGASGRLRRRDRTSRTGPPGPPSAGSSRATRWAGSRRSPAHRAVAAAPGPRATRWCSSAPGNGRPGRSDPRHPGPREHATRPVGSPAAATASRCSPR